MAVSCSLTAAQSSTMHTCFIHVLASLQPQVMCAPDCWSGPARKPGPAASLPSSACDGNDVHIGPGVFSDYPLSSRRVKYQQQGIVSSRCPGMASAAELILLASWLQLQAAVCCAWGHVTLQPYACLRMCIREAQSELDMSCLGN